MREVLASLRVATGRWLQETHQDLGLPWLSYPLEHKARQNSLAPDLTMGISGPPDPLTGSHANSGSDPLCSSPGAVVPLEARPAPRPALEALKT